MPDLNFTLIGAKIRERRLNKGITQETIANILDVNPSHISNIERGRANPSLTALIKIANILECSVDYFISNEYTYNKEMDNDYSLDNIIIQKLNECDNTKKEKLLKIMDIL